MNASPFRSFGGMCWPAPGERLGEVSHALTYGGAASKEMQTTQLIGASVVSAYMELIRLPAKKRNAIIRELRKGPGIVSVSGDKAVQQDEQKDSP